jgi:hypothetical protein
MALTEPARSAATVVSAAIAIATAGEIAAVPETVPGVADALVL